MTPQGHLITHRVCAGLGFVLLIASASASASAVRINEVSDHGTPSACDGEDWVELSLSATATSPVDLSTGYVLHDDKGADAEDALDFAALATGTLSPLEPGGYLLLCRGDGAGEFSFGIGGDDTVTLLDAEGGVVSTTGELPGKGDDGITYAYDDASEGYAYTSTPTPGAANEITSAFETVEEMKARLIAQEAEGTAFFNMDADGKEVEGGLAQIVNLHIEMDPDVRTDMHDVARSQATYRPWLSAQITDEDGGVILNLPSPGRIRPKGQSTLYVLTCLDQAVPYSLDFGKGAEGSDPAQTLFGVERAYLRLPLGDDSSSREWTSHRMLARFGLPHLRTRSVRVYINGEREALYELIEAPDQEYVYQRSFPNFDPSSYGLYKVKGVSRYCGSYSEEVLEQAKARVDEPNTPPYFYERGEHRPITPILGHEMACVGAFNGHVGQKHADATLAYVRSGEDCGQFVVDAGLIDRALGSKEMDVEMVAFASDHLGPNTCDPGCTNSDLAQDVDVTSFLRNLAAYAGMLQFDTPLVWINNFYLAYNSGLWSIVQWDHDNALQTHPLAAQLCDAQCGGENAVNWSILRPTCRAFETNQMFGPLLSDPELRRQYVEYMREFVNDVMTNDDFLGQIQAHLDAIKDDAEKPLDLVAGATPLLDVIRTRAASIKKQLDAIDAGTFPRDLDDIAPEEACVDWQLDGPRKKDGNTPVPTGSPTDGPTLLPTGSPTKNPTPSPTDAQKSNKSKASKSKASKSKTAKPAKPESVKSKTSKAKGAKGWFA